MSVDVVPFADYAACIATSSESREVQSAGLVEDLPGETWRAVAEFPDSYEVSNLGRIRSCFAAFVRMMKPALTADGYLIVGLYPKAGTSAGRKTRTVHSLVAAAFHGPRPVGLVVNHLDACKTNNRDTNLEYCTQAQNARHAGDLGLNGFHHRKCRQCGEKGHTVRSCRRQNKAVLA